MEVLLITGAMNIGVIVFGGAVNFVIHKWNRRRLQSQFNAIAERLEKKQDEIQQSINGTPANQEPFDVETPSECHYKKPEGSRNLYAV